MRWLARAAALFIPVAAMGQSLDRYPVIDVHLHSRSLPDLRGQGPNPVTGAPPLQSVEAHVKATQAAMERNNVVLGIVGGPLDQLGAYQAAGGARLWASMLLGAPGVDVAELRRLYGTGELRAMGEVIAQYTGLSPSGPELAPYFALAAELDIPVGIHTGLSSPGITRTYPRFRVALGNPIHLEELLNRHPDLRVYVMHAGWPFLSETIGILGIYPQVYVDIGLVSWGIPREEFYDYLQALVRAGFGDRIMFGSDQMAWPDAIDLAVETVKSAGFLSDAQKRAILYDNAARFLRLSEGEQAAHRAAAAGPR
jgi:predicted TIM-barrel fold metal-dependent hydrolase